ncbi:MAG: hypothetical protein V1775_14330 [Bacteroidota bacterium]
MLARRFLRFVPLLTMMLLLFACSPERRLANMFVKTQHPVAVMFLTPDFSYRYSFKVPDIENFDSLPAAVQDSLLYYNSGLIQYLNDSILITGYLNGMSSGLKALGLNVFPSGAAEQFVNSGSEALIVNLVQLQLEEFYDSISDEASFGEEELYNYDLFITAVNINSWFEVSGFNQNDTATRVLFASQTITDYFEGGFRYFPFTGDVKYSYIIDSLDSDDFYREIRNIGLLYSGYLYDYLMNDYIRKNLPDGAEAAQLYTFDRYSGVVRKNKGQGFTRLN